jgi:hypothetical protein
MGLVIWSDVDTTTFDLFGLESEEPNTPSFITKFINGEVDVSLIPMAYFSVDPAGPNIHGNDLK